MRGARLNQGAVANLFEMQAKADTTLLPPADESSENAPSNLAERVQGWMKHPWAARIATLVWLGILGLAVWALYKSWHGLQWKDFLTALQRIGPAHIALAACFTTISYLCNSSLDLWAMRNQRLKKTPWPQTLATSFVAMTFSINAGGAILSGGSVRLRSYMSRGVTPLEIGKLMVFISLAAYAGYSLNAGLHLTLSTDDLPGVPAWLSANWAGPALLITSALIIGGFMAFQAGKLTRWLPEKWGFKRAGSDSGPLISVIPAAALASACDYLCAGLTLRALFPEVHGIHLSTFLAAFAISQCLAAISHVPGGAGVLELLLNALLGGTADTAAIASSLIAFRVIFYIIPFVIAAVMLALGEIWLRRQGGGRDEAAAPSAGE